MQMMTMIVSKSYILRREHTKSYVSANYDCGIKNSVRRRVIRNNVFCMQSYEKKYLIHFERHAKSVFRNTENMFIAQSNTNTNTNASISISAVHSFQPSMSEPSICTG